MKNALKLKDDKKFKWETKFENLVLNKIQLGVVVGCNDGVR